MPPASSGGASPGSGSSRCHQRNVRFPFLWQTLWRGRCAGDGTTQRRLRRSWRSCPYRRCGPAPPGTPESTSVSSPWYPESGACKRDRRALADRRPVPSRWHPVPSFLAPATEVAFVRFHLPVQGGGLLHLLRNDLTQDEVEEVHPDQLRRCSCGGAQSEVFEQAWVPRFTEAALSRVHRG